MLKCVQEGLEETQSSVIDVDKVRFGLGRLQVWDYRHESGSVSAAVFEAWEFQIVSYLHEAKIEDKRLRRSIFGHAES